MNVERHRCRDVVRYCLDRPGWLTVFLGRQKDCKRQIQPDAASEHMGNRRVVSGLLLQLDRVERSRQTPHLK